MIKEVQIKKYNVLNMSCIACVQRIEKVIGSIQGVEKVTANYTKEEVVVEYNPLKCSELEIIHKLNEIGYPVSKHSKKIDKKSQFITWSKTIAILIALFFLYKQLERTGFFNAFPIVDEQTALPMLFVIGMMTSVHCIAMCGGINISQCAVVGMNSKTENKQKLLPSLLYNSGRVVSYTVIGAIVGGIGSVLILSGSFKGMISILSSFFMLIMGMTMLGAFPVLRKLIPRMPKKITKKINKNKNKRKPFVVGLINGFMPCGPLQAMQLYALSTGSIWLGAISMFLFSLGTVPLMLLLGIISSYLSSKFTNIMMKVSALLVIILGFMMLNTGLVLSGFNPLF